MTGGASRQSKQCNDEGENCHDKGKAKRGLDYRNQFYINTLYKVFRITTKQRESFKWFGAILDLENIYKVALSVSHHYM